MWSGLHMLKGLGLSERGPRHQHPAHWVRFGTLVRRNGVIAIVAAISLYREVREEVRRQYRRFHRDFTSIAPSKCSRKET